MTTPAGPSRRLQALRLSDGHFAANANLQPGRVTFAVDAIPHGGAPVSASFSQQIK
jgi:hypothetical protein